MPTTSSVLPGTPSQILPPGSSTRTPRRSYLAGPGDGFVAIADQCISQDGGVTGPLFVRLGIGAGDR